MLSITDDEVMIEITNMLGQTVYKDKTTATHGVISAAVQLGSGVANGMYVLTLRSGGDSKAYHFVLED